MTETLKPTESRARRITSYILDKGLSGIPPLSSASALAMEYQIDQNYQTTEERVNALINWETSKNFTTGFITGLGGLLTMPISIPSALGASWIIQARMSGAIAMLHGYELSEDRVRTFVLLSLAGDSAKEVLKAGGIKVGNKLTQRAIAQIPGRSLVEINKVIGFRLITKAGEKGIVNLSRFVPVAGGLIGGSFDALTCRVVGRTASRLFSGSTENSANNGFNWTPESSRAAKPGESGGGAG